MANEKRLIDAKFAQHIANVELSHDDAGTVQWVLSHTPTVDAVEVVRCKDCKHYMTIHCTCDGCCIADDWYCADGERKGE